MIGPILGGVVEDIGKEYANGDSPLVKANHGSTNPLWGTLGLVQRDQSGNQTDAEASPDTTNDEEGNGSGSRLHGDTDAEDKTCRNKTPFATEEVSKGGAK